jgi:hypothetical protein
MGPEATSQTQSQPSRAVYPGTRKESMNIYIAIGLALLALICWEFYRLGRSERARQYWLMVEAEALRRENLRAKLYNDAVKDRRD